MNTPTIENNERVILTDLFPILASPAPELARARARLAAAQAAYDAAMASDEQFDGFGETAYPEQAKELRLARRYAAVCELRAMCRAGV